MDRETYRFKAYCMNDGEILEDTMERVWGRTSRSHMYGGKDSWLVNFKNREMDVDGIRIYLDKGQYEIDDFIVYFESEKEISDHVNGLIHPDDGLRVDGNTITTNVDLEQDGFILITIPYSEGWKLYVDGSQKEILRADETFIGVNLEKGHHEVILRYSSPMVLEGMILSAVLIIGGILTSVVYRTIKKKKKGIEND